MEKIYETDYLFTGLIEPGIFFVQWKPSTALLTRERFIWEVENNIMWYEKVVNRTSRIVLSDHSNFMFKIDPESQTLSAEMVAQCMHNNQTKKMAIVIPRTLMMTLNITETTEKVSHESKGSYFIKYLPTVEKAKDWLLENEKL